MKLDIYVDGGARGNPGPAAIGAVIKKEDGQVIEEYKEYIGEATNNVAEYRALLKALELAAKHAPCALRLYTDSELMCNQMLGNYKVRNDALAELFASAQGMLGKFENVSFFHIPREQNKQADKLVNQALNIAESLNKHKKER